ncbi:MAG TPA: T9SS type A sorting domain-containing protein, partial [Candidatus Kapabacteria bacterium]|nr:T9SS type A sorting domain-containing protein [Candidatus Kapabacteria bacterium]
VTADAPGPQITTVTFLGAECDTPIVITFMGDFQEWPSSVQHESPVEAAKWDGRSITFSRFPTNVLIYDVLGRLIQTIVQPAAKLDLSHLQPGIYVINWEDERGSAAIRIHRQQ